jgi:hypothetical protein
MSEDPDVTARIVGPVITRMCTESHAALSGTRTERNIGTFDSA